MDVRTFFSRNLKNVSYHFRNYNSVFFVRIFSLKNQTENDKAVSRNAVTVVGLERQVLVGRIKSGFALFFGQNMFRFGGG